MANSAATHKAWWPISYDEVKTWKQMFSALLPLCEGNPPIPVDSIPKGPVMLSFCVFFVINPNKMWNKQQSDQWLGDALVLILCGCDDKTCILYCGARMVLCGNYMGWWISISDSLMLNCQAAGFTVYRFSDAESGNYVIIRFGW